jgi:hypothetical protein
LCDESRKNELRCRLISPMESACLNKEVCTGCYVGTMMVSVFCLSAHLSGVSIWACACVSRCALCLCIRCAEPKRENSCWRFGAAIGAVDAADA